MTGKLRVAGVLAKLAADKHVQGSSLVHLSPQNMKELGGAGCIDNKQICGALCIAPHVLHHDVPPLSLQHGWWMPRQGVLLPHSRPPACSMANMRQGARSSSSHNKCRLWAAQ